MNSVFQNIQSFLSINKSIKTKYPPLYSIDHPAYSEIREAEIFARKNIKFISDSCATNTIYAIEDAVSLIGIIDRAIKKAPDDLDLLYAKCSACYIAQLSDQAEEIRLKILNINPDHFDAKVKGNNSKSWEMVFSMPEWDEDIKIIPQAVNDFQELSQLIQIVRDNLRPAIAVVFPAALYTGISLVNYNKCRWELMWTNTPFGYIATHYLMLDNGVVQEGVVPHSSEDKATVRAGYWLLRRLADEDYCFIVITYGEKILVNQRYFFPQPLKDKLRKMGEELKKITPLCPGKLDELQKSAQWFTDKYDINMFKY